MERRVIDGPIIFKWTPECLKRHVGLRVHWERGSLRDFEEAPERYVDEYDLMVVGYSR